MKDKFGNYVCQKLMVHCSPAQIDELVDSVLDHGLVGLSRDRYSTRALQLLIGKLEGHHEKVTLLLFLCSSTDLCVLQRDSNLQQGYRMALLNLCVVVEEVMLCR